MGTFIDAIAMDFVEKIADLKRACERDAASLVAAVRSLTAFDPEPDVVKAGVDPSGAVALTIDSGAPKLRIL